MSIEHKVTCGCKVTPCCFYLSRKPLQWNKLNNVPSVHSCRWRGHWNDPGKTPPPYLEFSVSFVELHLHLFLMFTFLWWSLSSWKIQEKSLRSVFFTDLLTFLTLLTLYFFTDLYFLGLLLGTLFLMFCLNLWNTGPMPFEPELSKWMSKLIRLTR